MMRSYRRQLVGLIPTWIFGSLGSTNSTYHYEIKLQPVALPTVYFVMLFIFVMQQMEPDKRDYQLLFRENVRVKFPCVTRLWATS